MEKGLQLKHVRCCLLLAVVAGGGMTLLMWVASGSTTAGLVIGVPTVAAIVGMGLTHARLKATAAARDVLAEPPPGPVRLGETFRVRVTVTPKRALVMGPVTATLRCREHAISRGSSGDTSYRHTIHEAPAELGEQRQYSPGEVLEVAPEFTIPADGLPSMAHNHNSLIWDVMVSVPVKGWCPNIKLEVPVTVSPTTAPGARRLAPVGMPTGVIRGPVEQGPVRVEFSGYTGPMVEGVPAVSAGERLQLRVVAHTSEDIRCRGLNCWVGCRIHGSGDTEHEVLLNDEAIHWGDFMAGTLVQHELDLEIPADGPVSYAGRYIKCDWYVRLRVDIPIWRDKRLDLPFIVTTREDQEPA